LPEHLELVVNGLQVLDLAIRAIKALRRRRTTEPSDEQP
jgi:hypothetical protein